jgi:hypothetical protein
LLPRPRGIYLARTEKFSVLPREARRSNGKVWILVKKSSDFNQKTPTIFKKVKIGGEIYSLKRMH